MNDDYLVVDFDDFGINKFISDQCQTRDCRAELYLLKQANPDFKVTLFTVPANTTLEMLKWAKENKSWVQLGVHGWAHTSNWEAHEWTTGQTESVILPLQTLGFKRLFKAPGWQISDGALHALHYNNWAVADQPYNDDRRPKGLKHYVIRDESKSIHGHTWNCVGNGIEETLDELIERVKAAKKFKFVTEVLER